MFPYLVKKQSSDWHSQNLHHIQLDNHGNFVKATKTLHLKEKKNNMAWLFEQAVSLQGFGLWGENPNIVLGGRGSAILHQNLHKGNLLQQHDGKRPVVILLDHR